MAGFSFRRDSAGIRAVLNSSEVAAAVHAAAEQTASGARSALPDAEVVVDDYRTDRSASSVTIKHPRARLMEVRYGALTRAAAAAGLEVTRR